MTPYLEACFGGGGRIGQVLAKGIGRFTFGIALAANSRSEIRQIYGANNVATALPGQRCEDVAKSRLQVLQVIRQLVCRLVKLHVIRARHDHHDHATVHLFLDRAAELRSFRPQLFHRRLDVIAHDRDRVVPRVIIGFAFPHAVCRVHTHLARSRFEDQPVVIPIFGHILPAEHVPQKRPRRFRVIRVNQGVN
jgi:hypothetical protein